MSATIGAGRCRDQRPSRRPEDGEAMGRVLRCGLAEQALPEAPTDRRRHATTWRKWPGSSRGTTSKYTDKCTQTPVKLDRDQMLANVYSSVPFNSCVLPGGDMDNELVKTPGIGGLDEYRKISHAYVDLQYNSPPDPRTFGDFNRLTELIHSTKYLHVGGYAFSIDDAAGNMLEVGDGVNITVGGTNGLGNSNPYDPWRFFLFNVGAAKETGPRGRSSGFARARRRS